MVIGFEGVKAQDTYNVQALVFVTWLGSYVAAKQEANAAVVHSGTAILEVCPLSSR